ncbi:MAG: hypothetical protein KAU21_11635, partial [Gammaproteobacteria bacterium]|nr:hypothetical protein [Gammaproteobacteria bacterium]
NGQYVDIYTESKGLGPRIAGYETEEYEIFSNDKYCGSTFVSVRAIQDLGLRKFLKAFDSMSDYIERKMSGLQNMQSIDTCEQADRKMADKLLDLGFPLRSTDKYRQIKDEVTRINNNAKLPANAFVLPAHYQITTPEKLMENAVKQIQPQMLEMLKNLPPEAREMMMKQLQNMGQ